MNTEKHCEALACLDPVAAIRAIHEAYLTLQAIGTACDVAPYDLAPAQAALRACLVQAGHVGFTPAGYAPPATKQKAPARRAKPGDPWSDPEARKIRTRVRRWASANLNREGPASYEGRNRTPEMAYADALGVSVEEAAGRIAMHREFLNLFDRSGGKTARP